MPRAVWNGVLLAESDQCELVEGNYYFPPEAIDQRYFKPSATRTTCSWKGVASYYDLDVGGQINKDAAWFYPEPKEAAVHIRDRVAFWKGVTVEP